MSEPNLPKKRSKLSNNILSFVDKIPQQNRVAIIDIDFPHYFLMNYTNMMEDQTLQLI